uniref:peptidylprolyl isomerase n=1 Tax=Masdevallia picturata TaxID=125444 RepID=A0A0F7GZ64_9ASPA
MSFIPISSSAPVVYTATLFRLQQKLQNNHFFQVVNLYSKAWPQKPNIAVASQLPGRRETSFVLASLSLVSFLDLSSLTLPSLAISAGRQAEPDCPLTVSPSGLAFCDRVVGSGAEATKGLLIKAHYVGRLENGMVFDSSYDRGRPITFRVGVGEVIKGWDQGILGVEGIPPMLAGGKRTLKLPPELGYGMRGAGCKGGSCIIPPYSTLLFDVEFIGKAEGPATF